MSTHDRENSYHMWHQYYKSSKSEALKTEAKLIAQAFIKRLLWTMTCHDEQLPE